MRQHDSQYAEYLAGKKSHNVWYSFVVVPEVNYVEYKSLAFFLCLWNIHM